ncbi:MAG: TRAP transporter small permease [Desulfobacteraceae bacterium]|nr:MAG: TRAP transporter small permease [Desulfobacteraceae bacterium]
MPGAFKRAADMILETVGSLLLLGVTVLAVIQVILRYVFNYAFIWSEELSRLLFVWIILLGAALGISYRKHMVIEFVQQRFPGAAAAWIALGLQLMGLVFLAVLVVKGIPLIALTSTDYYVTLPFSVMYAYLAAVVGGGMMIFYWLFEIGATLRRLLKKDD